MLWRNQPTVLCFHLFAMVRIAHIYIEVNTLHNGGKQDIDRQIFSRKSISRKILSPEISFPEIFSVLRMRNFA